MNLNISTALFHTIKELQIKYEQEEVDEEEVCHDLTSSTHSDYRQLFRALLTESTGKKMHKFP